MIFGNQNHALELRVRIVIEGVLQKDKYLNNDYLLEDLSNFALPGGPALQLCYMSGQYDEKNHPDDVELIYNADIFHFRKADNYGSMWQLHQLAGALGRSFYSIYPIYKVHEDGNNGYLHMRKLYNRLVKSPHDWDDLVPSFALMWTPASYVQEGSPNHFVPVVG